MFQSSLLCIKESIRLERKNMFQPPLHRGLRHGYLGLPSENKQQNDKAAEQTEKGGALVLLMMGIN